jgi:hypothetical protein
MAAKQTGHVFAAEHRQLVGMRLSSPKLLVLAGAGLLLCAGSALAQTSEAVTTAGSSAGGVPTAADEAPSTVHQTPRPAEVQPLPDFRDLEAAADAGRKAPLLGEFHGEVGGVVGTGGLRGAYGHVTTHPSDNSTVDLRFSTIHQNGGFYGYGGYGGAYGPYYDAYGPASRYHRAMDPMFGPDPTGGLLPPGY